MTEKFNKYNTYKVDHTKFGGLIYPSDFNTDYRGKDNIHGSPIASRIERDLKTEKEYKIIRTKRMEEIKNVKRNNETQM